MSRTHSNGRTLSVLQLYESLQRRLQSATEASYSNDITYRNAIQEAQEFLRFWSKDSGPQRALLRGSDPVDEKGDKIWRLLVQANDLFSHLEFRLGVPQQILPPWKPVAYNDVRDDCARAFTYTLDELKYVDRYSSLGTRPAPSVHSSPSTNASDTPMPSSPMMSTSASPARRVLNRTSPTSNDEALVHIKQEQRYDGMEAGSHETYHGRKDSHTGTHGPQSLSFDQPLETPLPSFRDAFRNFGSTSMPPFSAPTTTSTFAAESPMPNVYRDTPLQSTFTEVPLPHAYSAKILPLPTTPRLGSSGNPYSPRNSITSTNAFHSPHSMDARTESDGNGAYGGTNDTTAMTAMTWTEHGVLPAPTSQSQTPTQQIYTPVTSADQAVHYPPNPSSDLVPQYPQTSLSHPPMPLVHPPMAFPSDSEFTNRFRPNSSYQGSSSGRHLGPS